MTVRILVFGAHPDDAEFHAGGSLAIHAVHGNVIHLVSVTDGSAGHHQLPRDELAQRRLHEAQRAAAILGATLDVWPRRDGELEPTLSLRNRVIVAMRQFKPDLVLTHRIHDYHPDHRAVAMAVRDACYMVRVPNVVPAVAALTREPVVAAFADFFSQPAPFRADAVVDIEGVFATVVAMLDCHASQVYEWIPHTLDLAASVPAAAADRHVWLDAFHRRYAGRVARHFAPGYTVAEAFEVSEYARRPTAAELSSLFPAFG
ncbi:MAG: PIG-L family deacetylase [Gammaproteobacteria bacterium]|nr:PIG-L family deacetylase [Gammaproteobacteria bacterium]